ncbi:TetR/AcrR family transcriptional regulator [Micromonospora maris]|uniref:TetR/AcrR family transcriptional regulator n=1 Tax=Micromonospora maris TaxID=1003110 RepID=UPI002E165E69|nr:TetR/AcrR family transcriptional regulator [Micromonospora maris]
MFRLLSHRDGGHRTVPARNTDSSPPRKRADAERNKQALLEAAAAAFVDAGVNAPVRDIAARAGVGVGTIYRHFPARADLIVAVYRHQVQACAEAAPTLLVTGPTPHDALAAWVDLFVDFLITKHGLAEAMRSDAAAFEPLHAYFLERLIPAVTLLLDAAVDAGQITPIEPFALLRGIGNLCIGADPRYDPRPLVAILIRGLHT